MSAGLEVDVEGLRAAAPKFSAASDRLGEVAGRLQGAVARGGGCWGADAPGAAFAGEYLPGVDAASSAVAGLVEVLAGIRTALDAAASSFEGTERATTQNLNGATS